MDDHPADASFALLCLTSLCFGMQWRLGRRKDKESFVPGSDSGLSRAESQEREGMIHTHIHTYMYLQPFICVLTRVLKKRRRSCKYSTAPYCSVLYCILGEKKRKEKKRKRLN